MRRLAGIALALCGLVGVTGPAQAQVVEVDLSDHRVAITTGFSGTELLLFGTIEEEGDVIVLVRGPEYEAVVRRKDRIAGVWMNRESVTFDGVPSFYAVAASRPLAEISTESVRERLQVGVEHLDLQPVEASAGLDAVDIGGFWAGLIRGKVHEGLFVDKPIPVQFRGQRLFRTTIAFPSNVPTGIYTVQVLVMKDKNVVSAQTTPLRVDRDGVGAMLYDFAHRQSSLYGVGAIIIAVFAGWAAAAAFQRS
jgi:uncharacterized protein (TIGR02186 family)